MNSINVKTNAGEILSDTILSNGMTTTELAKKMAVSQTYVSKWKHDAAPIRLDYIQRLLKALPEDNEFLALDLAHGISKFIPPVANGPKLYGISLSYASRSIVELKQAVDALVNSLDEFQGPADSGTDGTDPQEAVKQLLDAVFVGLNATIIICRDYNYSLCNIENEREKLWRQNGLIK